jgi:hypothetical protein
MRHSRTTRVGDTLWVDPDEVREIVIDVAWLVSFAAALAWVIVATIGGR